MMESAGLHISVLQIKEAPTAKKVKAYVDIALQFDNGRLVVRRWGVVDDGGVPPWVGVPSSPDRYGHFHKLVEPEGELKAQVTSTILDAYAEWKRRSEKAG